MNHIGGIYFEDAAHLNYHWKERFPLLSGRSSDQCERTKERQTETERCGSLVTSLFCVLCLDANAVWKDSSPSVCCAHARIFSSLLPPFFLFVLSFSFYFKCVLATCFLIVSQVFIVLVYTVQLKKKLDTCNLLLQAASLDDKNGKHKEMDLLCVTQ